MLLTLPFLAVVVLLFPLLAWSRFRTDAARGAGADALPSPRALALQTILVQGVLFGLAWLATAGAHLAIPWRPRLTAGASLAAIAVVALGLVLAWREAGRPPGPHDALQRALRRVPATDPLWLAATVAAAIAEEFAYRGVLTGYLAGRMGSGAAAAVSAALFGLAHLAQGWRGAGLGAVFALALQGIVALSGGLGLAMVVHLAYDFGAVWLGRRLGSGEERA